MQRYPFFVKENAVAKKDRTESGTGFEKKKKP